MRHVLDYGVQLPSDLRLLVAAFIWCAVSWFAAGRGIVEAESYGPYPPRWVPLWFSIVSGSFAVLAVIGYVRVRAKRAARAALIAWILLSSVSAIGFAMSFYILVLLAVGDD